MIKSDPSQQHIRLFYKDKMVIHRSIVQIKALSASSMLIVSQSMLGRLCFANVCSRFQIAIVVYFREILDFSHIIRCHFDILKVTHAVDVLLSCTEIFDLLGRELSDM